MNPRPRIFSLGDDCVTVDFGNEISVENNSKSIRLARTLNQGPFPGFLEAVPAFSSVSVFFDLPEVRAATSDDSVFATVSKFVERALDRLPDAEKSDGRTVEIEVDFGDESAPDLQLVAEFAGISRNDVIELFTSKIYRVYMLGFLPGFAYMGEVDEQIAMPRRESPRTSVPKGSVGIAGRQTGIYPFRSPGGWQIIGRTNAEMFSLDREPNSLLQPGDDVRFVAKP